MYSNNQSAEKVVEIARRENHQLIAQRFGKVVAYKVTAGRTEHIHTFKDHKSLRGILAQPVTLTYHNAYMGACGR